MNYTIFLGIVKDVLAISFLVFFESIIGNIGMILLVCLRRELVIPKLIILLLS